MTTSDVLIELRGASVRLGSHLALDGVDLSLRRGERVALLGANGSGKTTLLRLLHAQIPCSQGERIASLSKQGHEPRQAMLFQRPFFLRLSVWNNLRLALWLAGVPMSEHPARARAALQRVGLQELYARPARALSAGQQQRLALARAWAARPDILFLDEPTASLDPTAKQEVERLIAEIASEGVTVVMSTHNLGQAKRLASRVIYLDSGRLMVDRNTDDFFQQPLPAAAEQFVSGERA